MAEKAITITEAARNFADCVNRAQYQGASFVLLKNGKPVAKLVPVEELRCTGSDLARILSEVELSPEEAVAWQKDLKAALSVVKHKPKR